MYGRLSRIEISHQEPKRQQNGQDQAKQKKQDTFGSINALHPEDQDDPASDRQRGGEKNFGLGEKYQAENESAQCDPADPSAALPPPKAMTKSPLP